MPKRKYITKSRKEIHKKATTMMREEANNIYESVEKMKSIIKAVAPDELNRAESYWMGHLDGALENRNGYIGKSFISFEDTVKAIEEDTTDELLEALDEEIKAWEELLEELASW